MYGVSSPSQAKQLEREVREGTIFLPFTEVLRSSLDPAAYPRARRALCETLVGFASKVNTVASAWWQFVAALRDFVIGRPHRDFVGDFSVEPPLTGDYYFFYSYLSEVEEEGYVLGQFAFSEFMRELDAYFAPESAAETAGRLLERANDITISETRSLSAVLLERFHAVSLAGTLSESGLFEYVRNAFFEVTEALPPWGTLKYALQGVLVKLDGCTALGGSCEQIHWLIAELRALEASRARRKAWQSFWREQRSSSFWGPPPGCKRAYPGWAWPPTSPSQSGDPASEDSSPPTPSSPKAGPQEVFTIYIEKDLPSFLRRRGEFDDEFVHGSGPRRSLGR
eukprot:scaffold7997_cov126-Isochrysis_galbana.AAC.6